MVVVERVERDWTAGSDAGFQQSTSGHKVIIAELTGRRISVA